MAHTDTINNHSLFENCLSHIKFEISCPEPSMFRVAREGHLALYRAMVEVLKGSANLAVTGKPSKSRMRRYRRGDGPWKEIHKVPIAGCKKAWRFSEPVVCEPPNGRSSQAYEPRRDNYLVSFYDALAMIQAECFMHSYVMSKEVPVTDKEMKSLEWLHEDIRNEYEHFIPRYYIASIRSLAEVTVLSLRLSKELLFDSKNVIPHEEHKYLAGTIEEIRAELVIILQSTAV